MRKDINSLKKDRGAIAKILGGESSRGGFEILGLKLHTLEGVGGQTKFVRMDAQDFEKLKELMRLDLRKLRQFKCKDKEEGE